MSVLVWAGMSMRGCACACAWECVRVGVSLRHGFLCPAVMCK